MEVEIRKKGRDTMHIKDTLSLLKLNLESNPYFKFYMVIEDDMIGYMALFIRPELKTIHLYRIWYSEPEAFEKMKEIITYLGKQTKCKRLTIEVYKDEDALIRLHGFRRSSVIMERRI